MIEITFQPEPVNVAASRTWGPETATIGDMRYGWLKFPWRFQVNDCDLFGSSGDPWLSDPLLDVVFHLGTCVEHFTLGNEQVCTPGEHGDALWFQPGSDEAVRIRSRFTHPESIVEVSRGDLVMAIRRVVEDARRFIATEFPQMREHHQLGPWVRGERWLPSDEDVGRTIHHGRAHALITPLPPRFDVPVGRPLAVALSGSPSSLQT